MKKLIVIFISATFVLASCKKATHDLQATAPSSASTTTSAATEASATGKLMARFSYTAPDPLNIFEFQPISFSNLSLGAVKSVWEFGNTTKSSVEQPVMSYPMHGYYTVKLTIYDAQGNSQSVTKDVSILCLFANGNHPGGTGGGTSSH